MKALRSTQRSVRRGIILLGCVMFLWTKNPVHVVNAFSDLTFLTSTRSLRYGPQLWKPPALYASISYSDQQYSSYLATCIPGLAHVLQQELQDLSDADTDDIRDIALSGGSGVTFQATREASLRILCWTRTAHKLLELVASSEQSDGGMIFDKNDIHNFVRHEVNVKDLLGDGQGGLLTISCQCILNNAKLLPKELSHSHYTSLTIKNALCDVVRELRGDRPDVELENPDVPLVAILLGNSEGGENAASLSLYRSLHPPGSLHKRGYRSGGAIHKAAMKESLAAGLLLEAGFHKKLEKSAYLSNETLTVIDPMCGSGSFLVEGAMIASDIAPALMRIKCGMREHQIPPVVRWKAAYYEDSATSSEQEWKSILLDATKRAKAGIKGAQEKVQLYGNDIHGGALDILEDSLHQAGLSDLVSISNQNCYDLQLPSSKGSSPVLVLTNPPWGVRLTDDMEESWDALRHFLRDTCLERTEAWVLSGNQKLTSLLRLKRDRMIPIRTGEQQLRWIKYTIGCQPTPTISEHHDTSHQAKASQGERRAPRGKPIRAAARSKRNFAKRQPMPTKASSSDDWFID